jgi:hypothetical protein
MLGRTEALKPQLERAAPLEDSLRLARARAALAREALRKALTTQEARLVEHVAEIDDELAGRRRPTPTDPDEKLGQKETDRTRERGKEMGTTGWTTTPGEKGTKTRRAKGTEAGGAGKAVARGQKRTDARGRK